jgi:ubiquinol-cytochrome c reductase cytochrome c1 subunit
MKKSIALLALCFTAIPVWAAEAPLENIRVDTSTPTVKRGADTLMEICHGCHTLKYIRYSDLASLGIDKKKIDDWRGDQPLDAPLTGQMSDDAAMQSFGKLPPDLSLMAKAREGGANYVYSYLIGYYNTAQGETKNHIFPETKMPDVLGISGAADAAQRTEVQVKAREVVSFLYWAADPHEEERHRLGYYVIAYLFVLTTLLYFVKARIWSRLK